MTKGREEKRKKSGVDKEQKDWKWRFSGGAWGRKVKLTENLGIYFV